MLGITANLDIAELMANVTVGIMKVMTDLVPVPVASPVSLAVLSAKVVTATRSALRA